MIKKILLGAGAALLLVGAYIGSLYWRIYAADAGPRAAYEQIEKNGETYMRELQVENAAWDKLEAADTYGGATPQETWKMFVIALEAGDTDLAAKYFMVTKQEKEAASLRISKERGFLKKQLAYFDTIESGEYGYDKKSFNFITKPAPVEGLNLPFTYTLVLNPQTKVWKIESL